MLGSPSIADANWLQGLLNILNVSVTKTRHSNLVVMALTTGYALRMTE
jgi:hypothetical protein